VRYIAKLFLVSVLMLQIGAPWMLVQGFAWVSMAVTYSLEEDSLGRGLSKTFDGEHPCRFCKAAAKGSQSEKKPFTPLKEAGKLKADLLLSAAVRLPEPSFALLPLVWEDRKAPARSDRPLSPPPRLG
jgi:hypothetical protein